jgi:hypothetical protein
MPSITFAFNSRLLLRPCEVDVGRNAAVRHHFVLPDVRWQSRFIDETFQEYLQRAV